METACDGNVLLVGDGDFSFTISLLKHSELSASQMTTSNIETETTIHLHELARDNMLELQSLGTTVLLEVDARELHSHPRINQKVYERIIFNFPLADRHNIKKNRALLADFFSSSSQILAPDGQVMVTLCKGQGGTPADQPQRSWHDSWQIQAMAANSGFVLTSAIAFDATQYPEYHSVGFRFQDKSFNTGCSITHAFKKTDIVPVTDDIFSRGLIEHGDSSYSCSHYIAEKLKRNMLTEVTSPVCMVMREFERALSQSFTCLTLLEEKFPAILPGHRSKVVSEHKSSKATVSYSCETSKPDAEGDAVKQMKQQKNKDNVNIQKDTSEALFAHGLASNEHDKGNTCQDSLLIDVGLLPSDSENVYVLIKNVHREENVETNVLDEEEMCMDTSQSDTNVDTLEKCKGARKCSRDIDRVFHYRNSLLEHQSDLCLAASQALNLPSDANLEDHSGRQMEYSFIFSGQCCSPCPIIPWLLPVRHELIIMNKVSDHQDTTVTSQQDHSHSSNRDYESVLASIQACLQQSCVFKDDMLLEAVDCKQVPKGLTIDGINEIFSVKIIKVKHVQHQQSASHPIGIALKVANDTDVFCVVLLQLDAVACRVWSIPDPRLLWSANKNTLKELNTLSFSSPTIPVIDCQDQPSPASMASHGPVSSASHQPHFNMAMANSGVYHSVSIYPMKFVHDLSFWENGDTTSFDELDFQDAIRCVAKDAIINLSLVDTYSEPGGGRISRCYRMHFLSHDHAFPYSVSWKLQSQIRMEVSRRLCVALR